MAANSKIEWTDATVNFWWGCTKVGPGCEHCYAETWSKRTGESIWGVGAPRRKIKSAVALLQRLHNDTSLSNRKVFVQSMSDLFDTEVPIEWFREAWETIEQCDRLTVQVVTKRISVVEKRLAAIGRTTWPKHVGLIITIVNQDEADRDVPRLLALKAKLGIPWVGLSMEPLLGPVDLRAIDLNGYEEILPLGAAWLDRLEPGEVEGPRIDWVICGGESGPGARPMHPDWARSLRDQCVAAGVAFFFKQWGEWAPAGDWYEHHPVSLPLRAWTGTDWTDDGSFEGEWVVRIGKKRAGRLLDGCEWNEMPARAA